MNIKSIIVDDRLQNYIEDNFSDSLKKELQNYIERDIINPIQLLGIIMQMENNDYFSQHKNKIWVSKDGRWCTHVKKGDGKITVLRRKNLDDLIKAITDHYRTFEKVYFIEDIYELWKADKIEYQEISMQSVDKYDGDFTRFFKDSKINEKNIKYITEDDLEKFIKVTIKEKNLTKKAYAGLVTLLNAIFKRAKKMHLTDISITYFIQDLELPNRLFKKVYKDSDKEVFNIEEIPKITEYLKEHCDIWNLGLLLQFETGMRIGELTALRYDDIKENGIMVQRTEIKYKNEQGKTVVDVGNVPKTDSGYREVILPECAKWTLNKIYELNPVHDGYLFVNKKGKRIRGNTFNKRLSRVCDTLGLPHRSSHKIRKTYATMLLDNDVDTSFVAQQLGHSDVKITLGYYYYCNKTKDKKIVEINNAIDI